MERGEGGSRVAPWVKDPGLLLRGRGERERLLGLPWGGRGHSRAAGLVRLSPAWQLGAPP